MPCTKPYVCICRELPQIGLPAYNPFLIDTVILHDIYCLLIVPPQHSGKLHSTPELGDLMNLVAAKIPEKWREVGIGLGLDTTDIKRIEADVPTHKSTLCYVDVFDTWKNKGTTKYTWGTLLKALRTPSVDASKLASTIEGQLS